MGGMSSDLDRKHLHEVTVPCPLEAKRHALALDRAWRGRQGYGLVGASRGQVLQIRLTEFDISSDKDSELGKTSMGPRKLDATSCVMKQ